MLRATPEKKEEKQRVRTELMRAALRLGAMQGFASLGLREVARAAGIAPTSFYRHFADMEELGLGLVQSLAAALVERTARCVRDAAARHADELAMLIETLAGELDADPELLRFIISERVGAVASMRTALRQQLALLSASVPPSRTGAAAGPGADAVVVLTLDALDRALDLAPDARAPLYEQLLASLRALACAEHPRALEALP